MGTAYETYKKTHARLRTRIEHKVKAILELIEDGLVEVDRYGIGMPAMIPNTVTYAEMSWDSQRSSSNNKRTAPCAFDAQVSWENGRHVSMPSQECSRYRISLSFKLDEPFDSLHKCMISEGIYNVADNFDVEALSMMPVQFLSGDQFAVIVTIVFMKKEKSEKDEKSTDK